MKRFWEIMYALALAEAMHKAPFKLNVLKLKYTHYRCVWCWAPAGTRKACNCSYEKHKERIQKSYPEVIKKQ